MFQNLKIAKQLWKKPKLEETISFYIQCFGGKRPVKIRELTTIEWTWIYVSDVLTLIADSKTCRKDILSRSRKAERLASRQIAFPEAELHDWSFGSMEMLEKTIGNHLADLDCSGSSQSNVRSLNFEKLGFLERAQKLFQRELLLSYRKSAPSRIMRMTGLCSIRAWPFCSSPCHVLTFLDGMT